MRIGMAIYNFNPRKGGAERYAYDLAINLAKKGHEVYVYCSRGVWIQGIHFIRINTIPYPRWLRNFSFAIKHHKYARAFPLDVMLGFGNTLELDVYQSHGGVQQIWMEREIASYDNPREQRYRAFLLRHSLNQKLQEWVAEYPIRNRRYKRIVAISEMVKQHMVEHYGLKDSIDVVYNGVDTERFHPAEKMPEGIFTILFSAGERTRLFFSSPAITLSIAASKCLNSTEESSFLAAIRAASLHTFAISAPANPGVRNANLDAISSIEFNSFNGFISSIIGFFLIYYQVIFQ